MIMSGRKLASSLILSSSVFKHENKFKVSMFNILFLSHTKQKCRMRSFFWRISLGLGWENKPISESLFAVEVVNYALDKFYDTILELYHRRYHK